MVEYGPNRAQLREEARQVIRELAAQTAAARAAETEELPDGYYGWDSTPRTAVAEALQKAGIPRAVYRTEE